MSAIASLKNNKVIVIPVLLVLSLVAVFVLIGRPNDPQGGSSDSKTTTVMWETLAELDFKAGTAPRKLLDLSGTRVRIPGFIVPLESDDARKVSEFLLVPQQGACIHTPPPPQNQIVYVQMEGGRAADNTPFPVWVEGILNLKEQTHKYGRASFAMTGQSVERYKEQR